ncbi:MAG: hypothetical protein QNJ34_08750 [Xenococcaceae cyanobacterium MO_188.B29]|nr:hypothetical protein [Xenococcaceae cyanobacterium MO_188.B29]
MKRGSICKGRCSSCTIGGLNQNSNIRPNRLFTADQGIILYKAGQLKVDKLKEVINKIIDIFQ